MINPTARSGRGARLIALLLAVAMLLTVLPAAVFARETEDGSSSDSSTGSIGTVHVIVENTTFTTATEDGTEPAWTDTLVDTDVELTDSSTMMSCIQAAVETVGTVTLNDAGNYISAINDLAEKQASSEAGWMGTLNDWFVSQAFTEYKTSDGTLEAGDEIRVMYTSTGLGADLGGDYYSTDKTVKAVTISAGTLDQTFASDVHSYALYLPEGTETVTVLPTASNKNYQVRTYVGETEYKRGASIPVSVGTVITVKCGDPAWPSMSGNTGEAQVYTFTVSEPAKTISVDVSVSSGDAFLKDKNGADAIHLETTLDTKASYTIDDVLTAVHTQYSANGAADYATEEGTWGTYITKVWGTETNNCGYSLNGVPANGLTDSVSDGDYLEVALYTSAYPDTESYVTFDKTTVKTNDETSFELVLKAAGYDESYNVVMEDCAGATITVDGVATEFVTDENGKASITIGTVGTHIVSAVKTKTVNGQTVTAITAPVCTVEVESVSLDSGNCGNVIWNVRKDGTLEFSAKEGTKGDMGGSISKWSLPTYTKSYKDQIKSIVVKEGVTSIVNYAFYTLTPTSVSLPSTLTGIGDDTFDGVKSITSFTCAEGCTLKVVDNFVLKNNGTEIYMVVNSSLLTGVVTVPDGVTTIGKTFIGTDITGIILPDSVTKIAGMDYTVYVGPFGNCKKLESVTVPCSITESNTFKGCTSLKEVTLKEGVTTVASNAFSGCTALTTVNLPKSLTSISASAFTGCTALTTINVAEGGVYSVSGNKLMKNGTEIIYVLPGTETGTELVIADGVTAISDSAYRDNTNFTSVTLPASLKSIGSYAFKGCTNLTTVNFPEGLKSIGSYAFQDTGLTEISLPAGVTVGTYAFANTQITSLTLPDGLNLTNESEFTGCLKLTEVTAGGNLSDRTFQYCSALKTVTLRKGAESIGMQTFSGCTALETVTIPEGVTTIGSNAFQNCTALRSISLPASLTSLAADAFTGCTNLQSITFAEGSSYTEKDGVIYNGTQLAFTMSGVSGVITVADGTTEIGANAFENNTAITQVILPDSVKTIGDEAFRGCTGLTAINLPENLESIGYSAFQDCKNLTSLTFPDGLKTLGNSAFSGCSGLKGEIRLPGSITSFGRYLFQSCTGITSVYFEDAENAGTTYGSSILRDCTGLTEVRIPETYSSNFNNLVYGCTALKKMTVPASVTDFSSSYLPSGFISLDFQGITTIGNYMISSMTNLKELYLPATLTSYKDSGKNCHPEIIYFRGTEEQWNSISFGTNTLKNLEANGTVIVFNYGGETTGMAPVITTQPVSATYELGLRADKLTIAADEQEGVDYVYQWYCNGEYVASGKECAVSTGKAGESEYYCMVRSSASGTYAETKSDVVTVTIEDVVPFAGEGTKENPYQISEPKDLERLSVLVENGESYQGKYFQMTADLTLPENWQPIGCTKDGTSGIRRGANLNAFSGTFDGGNHTLTVPEGYRPLFAYVNGATICNLNIYGTKIEGYGLIDCFTGVGMSGTAVIIDHVTLKSGTRTLYSGLLGARKFENVYAGCSAGYNATITNCVIESGVVIGYTGDKSEIGGFAGRMQGTVENCVNLGTVQGKDYVGGIIATIDNAMGLCEVRSCSFDGTVSGSSNVGGIVGGGYNDSSAPNGHKITVESCSAAGTVSGDSNVGGILGGDLYEVQTWDNCPYTFCDNVFNGKISGNTNVGAIIGYYGNLNRVDKISGNYYAKDCGADQPVGKVYVVDTNVENPTAYGDTIYVCTETSVASCPSVAGCSWKLGYQRTDDPLGADISSLFAEIGAVSLEVSGTEEITADQEELTYTVSAKGCAKLATVTLTFELSGKITDPVAENLGSWFVIAQSVGTDGKFTVVVGNQAGVTGETDLVTLKCKTTGEPGEASVTLTGAELSVYVGERTEKFVTGNIVTATFTTNVDYSIYDVNCDGWVNQLDITRAQRSYQKDKTDSSWTERADVNKDGQVSILDFILILNNYTKKA